MVPHADALASSRPPRRARRPWRLAAVTALGVSIGLHALMLRQAGIGWPAETPSPPSPPVVVSLVARPPTIEPPAAAAPVAAPARAAPERSRPARPPQPRRRARPDPAPAPVAPSRPVAAEPAVAEPAVPSESVAAVTPVDPATFEGGTAAAASAATAAQPAADDSGGGQPADAARPAEPAPAVASTDAPVEPVAEAAMPPPVELRFEAFLESGAGDARVGSARVSLSHENGRYRMSLKAKGPLSSFAYSSEGRVDEHGFAPEHYTETREVAFRARVDRNLPIVAAGASDDGARAAMPPGVQDRLSVLFQLCWLARAHPERLVTGQEFAVPLASARSVDTASFRVGSVESLPVGGQTVQALRISRVRKAPGSPGIDVWLSNDVQRLPLGVQYVDRSRVVRFVIAEPR